MGLVTFTSSGFSMDRRRRAGSSHEGAETHSTEVHDVRHSEGQLREKQNKNHCDVQTCRNISCEAVCQNVVHVMCLGFSVYCSSYLFVWLPQMQLYVEERAQKT